MNATELKLKTKPLEAIVLNFIREYVEYKTEKRCNIKTGRSQNGEFWKAPKLYRDACEKICSTAFYSLRACKNQEDFLQFFSASLCSVPHALSSSNYQIIASCVLDQEKSEVWKEVQALCMLSLSKFSYFGSDSDEKEAENPAGELMGEIE